MSLSGKRQESMTVNDARAVFDAHQMECEEILQGSYPLRNGEAQLRQYAVKRLRQIKLLRARMHAPFLKQL